METKPKLWICPICYETKKAQGRGAHLRLAHELVIKKITDEELKFAIGGKKVYSARNLSQNLVIIQVIISQT